MKELIFTEGYNYLTRIRTVDYIGYEEGKYNTLSGLTEFTNSRFIITANKGDTSLLSTYSKRPGIIGDTGGQANIYKLTNEKNENWGVYIHQGFFKLSEDGYLRKLCLQAWHIGEIITSNEDVFPKTGEWTAYFLIESGCGVYPVSVRPFKHNCDLFEISLESLSDIAHYAMNNIMFVTVKFE